jgi:hypothetical protein
MPKARSNVVLCGSTHGQARGERMPQRVPCDAGQMGVFHGLEVLTPVEITDVYRLGRILTWIDSRRAHGWSLNSAF